jgi:hypothetical protein
LFYNRIEFLFKTGFGMKKTVLLIFILLPVFFCAENAVAQFHLGVKAGYNASKLSSDMDTVSSNFKSGFQIGAFARLGKKFYLQPEVYYTTQGGVFTSNTRNWTQNIKIGSLDVPVLIGVKLIDARLVNVRILAGPAASFTVNKSIEQDPDNPGPITPDDLQKVNWSIQAGAGIDVWAFTFDVRYQVGLSQLVKSIEDPLHAGEVWQFNSKNNVWVLSLGFKIL